MCFVHAFGFVFCMRVCVYVCMCVCVIKKCKSVGEGNTLKRTMKQRRFINLTVNANILFF